MDARAYFEQWESRMVARDSETGCWDWQWSVTSGGYGYLVFQQQRWVAHRFVYEALVGPIPPGLVLDHRCRNRRCVNPAHLEPVTHVVNLQRGKRSSSTCRRGHLRTAENTWFCSGRPRCRICRQMAQRRAEERGRELWDNAYPKRVQEDLALLRKVRGLLGECLAKENNCRVIAFEMNRRDARRFLETLTRAVAALDTRALAEEGD